MNNILRNVLMRRSTMQFEPRPIRDEAMMEILEEGKLLSNAPNNQEWHFTVVQNRGLLRRFHELFTFHFSLASIAWQAVMATIL